MDVTLYEIEFLIPIVTNDPFYYRRIIEFKQIGLLNIPEDKRIKVVLLAKYNADVESLVEGWPDNCDVFVKQYINDWHVYKLCQYYLGMDNFDSKWYATIDDDSVNNVGGLIKSLSRYNYEDNIYISTPFEYYLNYLTLELKIIKRLGALHLLNEYYDHDWESHFASRASMIATLNNPISRKFIRRRGNIMDGFSDQFLPYAARIAGASTVISDFSTPHPEIHDFSLFGGKYDHIHYVSYDYGNTEIFKEWLSERNAKI